ncbi:MAG: hypothetical protein GY696_25445 [Gammaproteobacteria bacterium]|nr:hypothetical protein [Gammaproteobacteria bacterium]
MKTYLPSLFHVNGIHSVTGFANLPDYYTTLLTPCLCLYTSKVTLLRAQDGPESSRLLHIPSLRWIRLAREETQAISVRGQRGRDGDGRTRGREPGPSTAAKTEASHGELVGTPARSIPPEERQGQKKPQPSRMGPLMKRGW